MSLKKISSVLSRKNLTSKVVSCPSCKQQIRIPIRQGKTLEIRCQKCATTFQIHFQNPLQEIIKWDGNKSFFENINQMQRAFNLLPYKVKLGFFIQILIVVLFIIVLISVILGFFAIDGGQSSFTDPHIETI